MDGYMIDVECDAETLRVHAKTKAARRALTGWDVTLSDDKVHVEISAGDSDVEILRSNIAGVTFKNASPLINGNLIVTTTDGKSYQLHFRRKQRAGFETLARDLGAVLN